MIRARQPTTRCARGAAALAVGLPLLLASLLGAGCDAHHDAPAGAASGAAAPIALDDPAITDFRATERACIRAFNDALAAQRANQIDELMLADRIEHDALTPWRAMRARVEATPPATGDAAFRATFRRYLAERQTAWEAYVAALRASSEAASRTAYDAYHAATDAATSDARRIGAAFRQASGR